MHAARERFNQIVTRAEVLHFPAEEDLEPAFELAIIGIPHFLLFPMERALRNHLERAGVRLRWHARGDAPLPGNANAHTEQFELISTDDTGETLAGLYEDSMAGLEAGRRNAINEVTAALRTLRETLQETLRARCATLRQDQRREIARTRAQLRHAADLQGVRLRQRGLDENVVQGFVDSSRANHRRLLQGMRDRHRAAIRRTRRRITARTPRVSVLEILEAHLTAASQMH